METFRPKEVSLLKRIFESPILQFGVLFLLAGGAAFFLYQRDRANLQARVSYLKGSVQVTSTDDQPSNKAFVEKALEEETPETETTPPPPTDEALAAASTLPLVPPDAKDAAKDKVAPKTGPVLRVFYAEVSRSALQRIFEESQATGQFMTFKDDYSAGIIPNIDNKLSPSNTNIKILHKEERPLEMGKPMQWFYGLKDRQDPESEIGLTTFIEMSQIEAGTYRGNLEIQRSWKEPSDSSSAPASPAGSGAPPSSARSSSIQHRSFPAIFEIGTNAGFFISGVMPYKTNLDNDDELTSLDVFKIIKSEEFQRKGSDFVVFVELDPK